MRPICALLLPILALAAQPARGQEIAYQPLVYQPVAYQQFAYPQIVYEEVIYEEIVEEEGVPGDGAIDTEDEAGSDTGGDRFVASAPAPVPSGIAAYGPFRVLDAGHAALVDVTDERSPGAFATMLKAYPGIAVLEMVDCPGTEDDRANLRLGRMIHERGIATHVPDGGSVRSGAVELFLAGKARAAAPTAEFAVHAWMDQDGLQPQDYKASAPENRAYLDYYQAMGMSPGEASAFYAMTNSVPNADAKWLTAADMERWVHLDKSAG